MRHLFLGTTCTEIAPHRRFLPGSDCTDPSLYDPTVNATYLTDTYDYDSTLVGAELINDATCDSLKTSFRHGDKQKRKLQMTDESEAPSSEPTAITDVSSPPS